MPTSYDSEDAPRFRTPWFWWFVAIALSACFAAFSWSGTTYLFNFPAEKENYGLLDKIDRLPPAPQFKGSTAPKGEALGPIDLYSQFSPVTEKNRLHLNEFFRKQLVNGFSNDELVYYVEGEYEVEAIRDLGPDDFVQNGFAVQAHAIIRPDEFRPGTRFPVIIEYLLPNAKSAQKVFYPKGSKFILKNSPSHCSIIHTEMQNLDGEDYAVITTIPLISGTQKTPNGQMIRISLPDKYNLNGQFPIWNQQDSRNE